MKKIGKLGKTLLAAVLAIDVVGIMGEQIRWGPPHFPAAVPPLPPQTVTAMAELQPRLPEITARAACVMTGEGVLLGGKTAETPYPIASTTKILTTLLTLELGEGQLDTPFFAGDEVKVEGSALGIKPGAEVTLRLLCSGMLLSSGNDAAAAAAVRLGGSIEGFAALMNDRAAAIGMKNSCFVTPSGLDAEGQGVSAYDLALLTAEALRSPDFREICSKKQAHMTVGGTDYWMTNHNKLLGDYPGCIGVKTGFTDKAGRCLVAAAERDGATVIAVLLHDPNDWTDAKKLLDWGFSQLEERVLSVDLSAVRIPLRQTAEEILAGAPIRRLSVTVEPTKLLLAPGESITPNAALAESLPADARPGDPAGIVRWVDGNGRVRGWEVVYLSEE